MSDQIDVSFQVTPIKRNEVGRAHHVFCDVTIQRDWDALIFQNYYTAAITISQEDSTRPSGYVPVLNNYQLMAKADIEENAQTWFSISKAQFNSNYHKGKQSLRITMFQPASMWQTYEIRQLRFIEITKQKSKDNDTYNIFSRAALDVAQLNDMIAFDFNILKEAAHSQESMVIPPDLDIRAFAELKKNEGIISRKKDKKKKGTGSAAAAAAAATAPPAPPAGVASTQDSASTGGDATPSGAGSITGSADASDADNNAPAVKVS